MTLLWLLTLATRGEALEWACSEAGLGDQGCGRATCFDDELTAADALLALRTAVKTASCSACRCDTDSSGTVHATDALRILAASVNLPAELHCPVCNSLTIEADAEVVEVGGGTGDVVGTGDGGVVSAWVEASSVRTRRFDASLAPVGPPVVMASSPESMFYLRACGRPDGSVAVAWESEALKTFPVPHDYDDTGNVKAAQVGPGGETTGLLGLHQEAAGWQMPLGLFCLPSGGFTAIWRSSCIGNRQLTEGSSTSYTPQGCPLNGVWLRRFDADGAPLGEARVLVRTYSQWYLPWERAVALPDGRFSVASTNRLVVVDADGDVQSDTRLGSPSHIAVQHDCSAGPDRCVAVNDAYSLRAVVYDASAPAAGIGVLVRPTESSYEPPYDITIRTSGFRYACDGDGICLVAWVLVRDEEDWDNHYLDTTTLGVFGRALNLHTGEMGPEIALPGTRIVNAGPGRFVSIEAGDQGSVLRSLVVR